MNVSGGSRGKMRPSTVQEQKVLKGFYELGDTIGTGGFGKVKLAKHLLTGETVAVKIIDKSKLGDELFRVEREIDIMINLQHPRICKLYQVIESPEKLFMILEYCPNGELFDFILDKRGLGEEQARRYFRQIVSAVAYMHEKGCAHRDLKPENLLLDEEKNIKIIDFGLAARPQLGIKTWLDTFCGSPQYVAPEILAGNRYLGGPADVWSLGVILYAFLLGQLPFFDDDTNKLYEKIKKGVFAFPRSLPPSPCRDLISAMLRIDPSQRLSMAAVLNHPWVMGPYNVPIRWDVPENTTQDEKVFTAIEARPSGYELSERIKTSTNLKKFDYWVATFLILRKRCRLGKAVRFTDDPSVWLSQRPKDIVPFSPRQNNRQMRWTPRKDEPLSHTKRAHRCISFDGSSESSGEENDMDAGSSSSLMRESGDFKDPNFCLPPKYPSAETQAVVLPGSNRITPSRSVEVGMDDDRTLLFPDTKNKSKSVDDGLEKTCNQTPPKAGKMIKTSEKPGVIRKAFGSLEKFGTRMVDRLTPTRPATLKSKSGRTFRVLAGTKVTANVTLVPCKDPDAVFESVKQGLQQSGFAVKEKRNGLIFASKKNAGGELLVKLSLEICWLSDRNTCGYRRKRIEGDMFKYKMLLSSFEKTLVIPDVEPKPRSGPCPWVVSPTRLDFSPETAV